MSEMCTLGGVRPARTSVGLALDRRSFGSRQPCYRLGAVARRTVTSADVIEPPEGSGPRYRTAPLASSGMPPGIPYIVANEAAERFSYYGMLTILVVFMTKYLLGAAGELDVMSDGEARYWYHQFSSAVYLTPLFGALLADVWLGKYRTIVSL